MTFILDALPTNRKIARLTTQESHAHYEVMLKGHQPHAHKAAPAAPAARSLSIVAAKPSDETYTVRPLSG
jgi:hypothetical protein